MSADRITLACTLALMLTGVMPAQAETTRPRITVSAPAVIFVADEKKPQAEDEPAPRQVTFLGVVCSSPPELLREQLGLDEGIGLVVEHVAADSPAEKAGIKRHDILVKLSDQVLVNAAQLRTLVRSRKAGEKIRVQLLRRAKTKTIDVKLGEREEHPAARWIGRIAPGQAARIDHAVDAMEKTIERLGEQIKAQGAEAKAEAKEHLQKAKAMLEKQLEELKQRREDWELDQEKIQQKLQQLMRDGRRAWPFGDKPGEMRLDMEGGQGIRLRGPGATASASYADGEHTLTLKISEAGKHLTCKNREGKMLFEGPVDTPEQRKQVPAEVLKKLERLEKQTQINIQIRPGAPRVRPPAEKAPNTDV